MILFKCNRKYYERNAINQLKKWEADLEEIIDKIKVKEGTSGDNLDLQIEDLAAKFQMSKNKIDQMLNSPFQSWETEKSNYERVWSEVAPSFYKAKKLLNH